MYERQKHEILIIARMTPRLNGRDRQLMHWLSGQYNIQVISESLDLMTTAIFEVEGAHLQEIPLPFPNRRFWYFTGAFRALYFNLYGLWIAWKKNSEVIVCSDSIYIFAGIIGKLFLRRKFIYNAHEIAWGMGISSFMNFLLGMLERFAIEQCNFWLVPSEVRAQLILDRHHIHKPYVVYENFPVLEKAQAGIDREVNRERLYNAGVPRDCHVIMFQGSIIKKRGLEELIYAAAEGTFHLVIQGQGALLNHLRTLANSHVTFLEPCPNNEALAWLGAADLAFVYYENDCLNSAYASSNKFFASVFAEIPVICNTLPAFQKFAHDYGGVVLIETLDPDEIRACIDYIMNNPEIYERLRFQMRNAKKKLLEIPQKENVVSAFQNLTSHSRINVK
jgi:glycosyltransferase involved in cell wall biosynthesis